VDYGDINISRNWKSRDHQLGEKFRNLAPESSILVPYYRNQPSVLSSTPKWRMR